VEGGGGFGIRTGMIERKRQKGGQSEGLFGGSRYRQRREERKEKATGGGQRKVRKKKGGDGEEEISSKLRSSFAIGWEVCRGRDESRSAWEAGIGRGKGGDRPD